MLNLNNEIFDKNFQRRGSSFDVQRQTKTSENHIGCDVVTKLNCTADGMISAVKIFATDPKRAENDFVMIFLGSHGCFGELEGVDGEKVKLEQLIGCLSDLQAPLLKGKPRIIFVQACR